jgi:hypothetical protein
MIADDCVTCRSQLIFVVWHLDGHCQALLYFTFPAYALRRLQSFSHERASLIVVGGILFLLLAGLLGYHAGSTP